MTTCSGLRTLYIGSIGFYSVIGLNVDRAYVLSYPLKGRTSMKVLKLILVCWFLALFPSVPYLLDHTLDICAQNCTACWIPVDNVKYYLLEIIGGIFDLNLRFSATYCYLALLLPHHTTSPNFWSMASNNKSSEKLKEGLQAS